MFKINKISDLSPLKHQVVYILNPDITDVQESRIIDIGGHAMWSHGGPFAAGAPMGYNFRQYPFWITKENLLEQIRKNNSEN